MTNRKIKIKMFSLLFAVIMIFTAVPMRGISATKFHIGETEAVSNEYAAKEEIYVVKEDISKRGEFEKHFLCSDGNYIAVSYPNAIHFKDDNNEWQEFDNSLKLDTKSGSYKSSNGDFTVSLSQNTKSDNLITLQTENHEISWTIKAEQNNVNIAKTVDVIDNKQTFGITSLSLSNINVTKSEITEFKTASERLVSHKDAFVLPKYTSQVTYSNVFLGNNISLRYTLDANRIKEDILIYEKSDISSYIMDMQIGDLSALLNEDNSVSLLNKIGEVQYTIGTPYLVDAAFEYSYDVKVTIEQSGSSCKIKYTPDEKWLNSDDRVYPITLDPSVTTNEYSSNIIDTFAWKNRLVDQSSKAYLDVGMDSGDPSWAFIKFTLPNVNSNYYIRSAELNLTVATYRGSYTNNDISVHYAGPWSTGSSL